MLSQKDGGEAAPRQENPATASCPDPRTCTACRFYAPNGPAELAEGWGVHQGRCRNQQMTLRVVGEMDQMTVHVRFVAFDFGCRFWQAREVA